MNVPQLPKLDAILNTVRNLDQTQTSIRHDNTLVPPAMQMELASKATNQHVVQPHEMGPSLYTYRGVASHTNPNLFYQNYMNDGDAKRDHVTSLQNMLTATTQNTGKTSMPTTKPCHVYPPLLIRYNDPDNPVNRFIAVDVYAGGELHPAKGVPDLVINFHIDTHAITITSCHIPVKKSQDFKIVIWTLYAMHPGPNNKSLTISEFTQMYDQVRFEVMRNKSVNGHVM